ncbi:hypothetical protein HOC01_02670 [archaeon]|jgi:hypothetical protein|nr:hypothetical protein [archaeon]MBT6697776.1 hypothetical protein [archaeon]
MPRGRPAKSRVRQRIVEILAHMGKGYGYRVSKVYNEIYPEIASRLVYYHLRKGIQTGEFVVREVKVEKGNFSWGASVEKIYYMLGPNAEVKGLKQVAKFFDKKYK